ncbi:hypothetical protein EPA93_19810 [Ktedonosporobacter rubrisoli]|uniref:Uncharacterized protein n=1 Tax=Ktedonosporobacter rubrisoli TaxID=2509675 RepID=A0A4P6JSC5_KTERU|nr:hypothetical protein [Ktedonosporobacter rubrisoli]QBD78120.1 hypothetical protein EPA93_19810 [Ktedonosporobacter rubrisoli]
MKLSSQILFADEINDIMTDDEIDNLFSQLQPIEPPSTLVDSIMASVKLLSHTARKPGSGLIIHNEHLLPS